MMTILKVVQMCSTPGGFTAPARGWNSFGLQANPAINPSFVFDQDHVIQQANALIAALPGSVLDAGSYYISLDSGWSIGDHGDEYGRICYDSSKFDIPSLAAYLHSRGLKLGVYVLPGAFYKDRDKMIYGTSIPISATLSGNNNGFARCDFNFEKEGVQEWHNSVVALFAKWGIDFIKLDYVTPGSPENGGNLPPDNSGSVVAYHQAIHAARRPMRLDISWKLDHNPRYFRIWATNADSIRTDQDVNNSGSSTFVAWATVQRAIDNYRDFISQVVLASDHPVLSIYPDMDNLFVGNDMHITGISDAKRQTMASHWICAAANLITGSDMTRPDPLGIQLLSDPEALRVAQFTAKFPMQPRNPSTGDYRSRQLQSWIAGPDDDGNAIVVLANYGPDEGQAGFKTQLKGLQVVKVTWEDLGISGGYEILDVWSHVHLGTFRHEISSTLGEGESQLLRLTPVRTRD